MRLSLIVAYRNRKHHLRTQIAWWKSRLAKGQLSSCEMIIVEADEGASHWIQEDLHGTNIRYSLFQCTGVLHKTRALNIGLTLSQGQFVAPLDVDLIPTGDTLEQHLRLAETSPHLLVTGYRVMSKVETISTNSISEALENVSIAPEDMPTALWKHLVHGERFGIMPMFNRDQLIDLGGWDEAFIGWGAEDQDIIERYLQNDRFLARCPDLIYLHLFHEPGSKWCEAPLIEKNRTYYYRKRLAR